jgi:ABC-type lipoprotein export system ATPase subunit
MRRMNSEYKVTFVIVSHDLDLASRADRVIRLKDGHIISDERTAVVQATAEPEPEAVA